MAFYTVGKIVRHSLPVLVLTALISIFSGQILHANEDILILNFPVFLILIPPLIKVGGDSGSILGSRLSSALHLGLIDSKFERGEVIENNLIASFLIAITTCIILGIIVWLVSLSLSVNKDIGLFKMIGISTTAGFIQVFIIFSLTVVIALLSHRFGMDPDNTVIPIITTVGDLVGVSCIFLVLHLVGLI